MTLGALRVAQHRAVRTGKEVDKSNHRAMDSCGRIWIEMIRAQAKVSIIGWLLAATLVGAAEPKPLNIAWFSELDPEHSYWKQNLAFASAAAEDLGVKLVPHYVRSDQILYRELLAESVAPSSPRAVDGVIFLNIKRQGHALLREIEQGNVPAISNVLSMNYAHVGRPREQYDQWIGEIVDKEVENGYQLALRLIHEAKRLGLRGPDRKVHVVAINGKATDSAAERRLSGLNKALHAREDVKLHQTFYAPNWSRGEGELFTEVALKRYPHTGVIWAANDDILLGVLTASEKQSRSAGKDFVTGSIDGTIDVIRHVADGQVVCTIGGLSLHSGWAVILLHDYLHGIDFLSDTGVIIENAATMIDKENAHEYLSRFGDGDWSRVDFTQFSKVHHPELDSYSFSLAELLRKE